MDKEIAKLHRAIYIWENIGIGMNASIREKEIATKIFLEKNTDYNFYQVCEVIKLNKGTYYHYINDRKNRTQYEINDEKLSIEIRSIYDETEGRIGSNKIKAILESKNIKASVQKVRELMKKMNLKLKTKNQIDATKIQRQRIYFITIYLKGIFFRKNQIKCGYQTLQKLK